MASERALDIANKVIHVMVTRENDIKFSELIAAALDDERKRTIESCAKVAEELEQWKVSHSDTWVSDAIRSLKDKE